LHLEESLVIEGALWLRKLGVIDIEEAKTPSYASDWISMN
jgi:hypothetical protein